MRLLVTFSSFVIIAALGAVARAEPTATDRNIAQSLFDQARQLADQGKFDEACPKFEESQRLDPGGGTLLNLAFCHESQGKIASASTDFKEALSAARRDGQKDRETAAAEHIAALEQRLPHLTIDVRGIAPGEGVTVDGATFGRAGWGAMLAVDPGMHVIAASAPGKQSFNTSLTIAEAEKKVVTIPALADVGAAPLPGTPSATAPSAGAPEQPSSGSSGGSSNVAGWVIGGAGVVALGVGTYFGFQAVSKRHQSNALCPTDTTCSAEGVQLNDQAKTAAWIADFGVGLGLVGVAVGSYLLLSGGGSSSAQKTASSVTIDAGIGRSGGGVRLGGAF